MAKHAEKNDLPNRFRKNQSILNDKATARPKASHQGFPEENQLSRKSTTNSTISIAEQEAQIPYFQWDELVLGHLLGHGGFNDVYEVQRINTDCGKNEREDGKRFSSADEKGEKIRLDAKCHVARTCIREEDNSSRYVVKTPRFSTNEEDCRNKTGVSDLIKEYHILISLSHNNIISIRGACDEGAHDPALGLEGKYFIILDRLNGTLKDRLSQWRSQEEKQGCSFMRQRLGVKVRIERLSFALDVAAALMYLHSRGILYRDLKPDNIGYDSQGVVKIFDFGLATELQHRNMFDDGLYKLTSCVGSLRYMAPEVFRAMPYNMSADVYSFSILLWEICSLTKPYKKLRAEKFSDEVIYGGQRPKIINSWPSSIRSIIQRGWDEDLKERPTIDTCFDVLREEIERLSERENKYFGHIKQTSKFLIQNISFFRSMFALSKKSKEEKSPLLGCRSQRRISSTNESSSC